MKKKSVYYIFVILSIFVLRNDLILSQISFSDSTIIIVDENRTIKYQKILDSMNFPEGPAYDGKGNLYVSSCYGGSIVKFSENRKEIFLSSKTDSIKQTNGLTFYKDGSLFACDFGRGAILKIHKDKKIEVYANGFERKKFNRPNDLAFDSKGNLYFSDPKSSNKEILDGFIYRIDSKTKKVTIAASKLAYPNGLAFSKDGKYLYVCESARKRILKYKILKNGALGDEKQFAELPGGEPDGIALDMNENIYVAHFGGGNIFVFTQDGKLIKKIAVPGKKPSNLEFAGNDMKNLYITEDETNCVYMIKNNIPGFQLFMTPGIKNK